MTIVGSWGYYMQGADNQRELEADGKALFEHLNCPVHYPAFGKRLFECRCGIIFPRFVVQGAVESGDWSLILKQHTEGYKPTDIGY